MQQKAKRARNAALKEKIAEMEGNGGEEGDDGVAVARDVSWRGMLTLAVVLPVLADAVSPLWCCVVAFASR